MKTKISKHVTPLIQKDPGQYSVMTDPHAAMERGSGKGQLNPLGSCYFEIFKTKSQTNRLQWGL